MADVVPQGIYKDSVPLLGNNVGLSDRLVVALINGFREANNELLYPDMISVAANRYTLRGGCGDIRVHIVRREGSIYLIFHDLSKAKKLC